MHQYCGNPVCTSHGLVGATEFIGEIKAKINGKAPLFSSDDWFYEKALLAHYGVDYTPVYRGRGHYPHPRLVPSADLRYVQVTKKRTQKGIS